MQTGKKLKRKSARVTDKKEPREKNAPGGATPPPDGRRGGKTEGVPEEKNKLTGVKNRCRSREQGKSQREPNLP